MINLISVFASDSTKEPTQGEGLSNIEPNISSIGTGEFCSSLNVLGTYLYSVLFPHI